MPDAGYSYSFCRSAPQNPGSLAVPPPLAQLPISRLVQGLGERFLRGIEEAIYRFSRFWNPLTQTFKQSELKPCSTEPRDIKCPLVDACQALQPDIFESVIWKLIQNRNPPDKWLKKMPFCPKLGAQFPYVRRCRNGTPPRRLQASEQINRFFIEKSGEQHRGGNGGSLVTIFRHQGAEFLTAVWPDREVDAQSPRETSRR